MQPSTDRLRSLFYKVNQKAKAVIDAAVMSFHPVASVGLVASGAVATECHPSNHLFHFPEVEKVVEGWEGGR
jgi:hypothetical protein